MTGLFEELGTPAQRNEWALIKALESRRDLWPHEGYLYRSAGDLLLQHGQFYPGRKLPAEYEHLRGTPGRCFLNAMDAVETDPTLRYVEGVYAIGASHFTPHAWCLDPDGELLEVSLPTDEAMVTEGVEAKTGLSVLDVDRWGYYGVVLHPDLVHAVWATQEGHLGCFDRPTADTGAAHEEWRDEWPILRVAYDPTRRTLD